MHLLLPRAGLKLARRARAFRVGPSACLFATLCATLTLFALSPCAARADPGSEVGSSEWSLVGGRADPNLDVAGVQFAHVMGRWSAIDCDTFWSADLELWHTNSPGPAPSDIVTPGGLYGCRFPGLAGWSRLSAELGVGARVLSHISIAPDRDFSTAFQFQETAGLRFALDAADQWSFNALVRHVSNADIRRPNPGINAVLLSVGYTY